MKTTSDAVCSAAERKRRALRKKRGAVRALPASGLRFASATVDVSAFGKVAATRPNLPRLFRVLLALTGVRI
jgi:hypothetical protein